MKTIEELTKEGKYVHRYKKLVFSGSPTPPTQQREGLYPDHFDMVFESKEEFEKWYKGVVAGLANIDECLNYCEHFVRENGNIGAYEREGKRYYPVNGTWCGLHDYGRGESGEFFDWVVENFGKNWYELMGRYKNL